MFRGNLYHEFGKVEEAKKDVDTADEMGADDAAFWFSKSLICIFPPLSTPPSLSLYPFFFIFFYSCKMYKYQVARKRPRRPSRRRFGETPASNVRLVISLLSNQYLKAS